MDFFLNVHFLTKELRYYITNDTIHRIPDPNLSDWTCVKTQSVAQKERVLSF